MYLIFIFFWLTVLHPRHKVEYFKRAKWEKEWIDSAVDIVRDEFERTYADREIDVDHFKPSKAKNVSNIQFLRIYLLIFTFIAVIGHEREYV